MTIMTSQPSSAPVFRSSDGELISEHELEYALHDFAFDLRIGMTEIGTSFLEYAERELGWTYVGTEGGQ